MFKAFNCFAGNIEQGLYCCDWLSCPDIINLMWDPRLSNISLSYNIICFSLLGDG